MLMIINISTIQEMYLTEADVEFIAKVTRELCNYLGCLEKVGYETLLSAHCLADIILSLIPRPSQCATLKSCVCVGGGGV